MTLLHSLGVKPDRRDGARMRLVFFFLFLVPFFHIPVWASHDTYSIVNSPPYHMISIGMQHREKKGKKKEKREKRKQINKSTNNNQYTSDILRQKKRDDNTIPRYHDTTIPRYHDRNDEINTYRQYSQQRRLARILQPDHRDIHLGSPAGEKIRIRGAFHLRGRAGVMMVFPRTKKRLNGPTYQNILKSQS